MFNYFALIQLAAAIYVLYLVIRGNSKVFSHPCVKDGMEDRYRKIARAGLLVIGLTVLALSLLNIYSSASYMNGKIDEELFDLFSTIAMVLYILALTALLVVYLLLMTLRDKQKKEKMKRSTAPRAAFYFDDDETSKDAKAKKPQKKEKR